MFRLLMNRLRTMTTSNMKLKANNGLNGTRVSRVKTR